MHFLNFINKHLKGTGLASTQKMISEKKPHQNRDHGLGANEKIIGITAHQKN